MGVYPLNAVRYATQMEPVAVSARTEISRPEIFTADETTYFNLEFPGGIHAKCKTTFDENLNELKVNCNNGWYGLSPFQSYNGVKGKTSKGQILQPFQGNQQARQMDDDARAILNNQKPLVPGEEGLSDIRIVEAIFKSASKGGQRIKL
jgi:glucose-fructose oxidoreductase